MNLLIWVLKDEEAKDYELVMWVLYYVVYIASYEVGPSIKHVFYCLFEILAYFWKLKISLQEWVFVGTILVHGWLIWRKVVDETHFSLFCMLTAHFF